MSGVWWQVFPELSPGHTTPGSNGTVTAPTRTQHITKVAESGLHSKHGTVDIHFSHSSAIDGPSLAITPGADTVCVIQAMPLHLLWTHTPLQQTAPGTWSSSCWHRTLYFRCRYLPDFLRTSWPTPETRNLVFFMLTQNPLLPMPVLDSLSLEIHSPGCLRWAQCHQHKRSSHSTPVQNSCESASSTRMKSSELRTDPWCTPTPMPNSSLYWPLTCAQLWSLEYMPWMTCTAHFSTPRLFKAHHRTFLGIQSKAFSRLTKAK